MKAIASGRLCDLHCKASSVTAENHLQSRGGRQNFRERTDSQPESLPSNLNDFSKRASVKAENRGHSSRAVTAEKSGFDTLSVLHLDNQRNQAFIWEVGKSDEPVRLVKTLLMRERDELQAGPDQPEFCIRESQEQFVAYGLTFGARALTWLDSL